MVSRVKEVQFKLNVIDYINPFLQFSMVETVISGVMDAFPKYFRGKHLTVTIGVTSFGLISGLVFCTKVCSM